MFLPASQAVLHSWTSLFWKEGTGMSPRFSPRMDTLYDLGKAQERDLAWVFLVLVLKYFGM